MKTTHGVIEHSTSRPTDYLYRVSIKCLVMNEAGEVLAVKEKGRDWWDLPGGGMDHGETIRDAIAREMYEEVCMMGDFRYELIFADDPNRIDEHGFWQLRLVFAVAQDNANYKPGVDSDEIAFLPPEHFQGSTAVTDQRIWEAIEAYKQKT